VGGNPTTYTTWISYAAWQRSLVTGNTTVLSTIRDGAAAIFRGAYVDGHLRSSAGRPCWSQSDGSDAMEVRPCYSSIVMGDEFCRARGTRRERETER